MAMRYDIHGRPIMENDRVLREDPRYDTYQRPMIEDREYRVVGRDRTRYRNNTRPLTNDPYQREVSGSNSQIEASARRSEMVCGRTPTSLGIKIESSKISAFSLFPLIKLMKESFGDREVAVRVSHRRSILGIKGFDVDKIKGIVASLAKVVDLELLRGMPDELNEILTDKASETTIFKIDSYKEDVVELHKILLGDTVAYKNTIQRYKAGMLEILASMKNIEHSGDIVELSYDAPCVIYLNPNEYALLEVENVTTPAEYKTNSSLHATFGNKETLIICGEDRTWACKGDKVYEIRGV